LNAARKADGADQAVIEELAIMIPYKRKIAALLAPAGMLIARLAANDFEGCRNEPLTS
jgi:hypothetical protein